MTAVGIDVGTGSVRVYCENKDTIQTYEAEIATTHNANFITQSSKEIFTKILDLFARLNIDHVSGISTTATCSMVVLQKMEVNGSTFLKPFSQISGISDTNGPIPNQDVFLWMDGRAFKQTDRYNQRLRDTKFSSSVGGKFVPELGVPKLKWLSDNFPESNLVCFELYDWINYLLLVGGFLEKELVEYRPRKKDFNNDSSAMDGSIKGWLKQTLTSVFEISKNIEIGGADFDVATEFLLPVGYPLGTVHKASFCLQRCRCRKRLYRLLCWLALYDCSSREPTWSNWWSIINDSWNIHLLSTRIRVYLTYHGSLGPIR